MNTKPKIFSILILFFLLSPFLKSQEIFQAVRDGELDAIKPLLEKKPGLVNSKDLNNRTPLHFAAMTGNQQIAEYLISKGAVLDPKNSDGRTPLHFASSNQHKELVEYLIYIGADLEAKDIYDTTPLGSAVYGGDIKIIEFLLEKGSNLHTVSGYGGTLLHAAASRGRIDLVELFINKGLDINIQKADGPAPLHIAAAGGHQDLCEFMLKNGAKINIKRRYNLTPLHFAAANGHKEVVELLLSHGADQNIKCSDGRTPLHMAEDFRRKEIFALLSAKGARKISRNFRVFKGKYLGMEKPGSTPIVFAPGILINILSNHVSMTFSPDGKQIYWTADAHISSMFIWFTELKEDKWTQPQIATFSGKYYDRAPFFSPAGKQFIFQSNRPTKENPKGANHIWYVEKNRYGWSDPKYFKIQGLALAPSMSKDGTIYFQGLIPEKNIGWMDIFRTRLIDGEYSEPENLGKSVNSKFFEITPFVSANQDFIIFSSVRSADYPNRQELYISYRKTNNTWTKAKNMGSKINDGKGWISSPVLSPDGRFLFFAKRTHGITELYWVDAKIIDQFKPEEIR